MGKWTAIPPSKMDVGGAVATAHSLMASLWSKWNLCITTSGVDLFWEAPAPGTFSPCTNLLALSDFGRPGMEVLARARLHSTPGTLWKTPGPDSMGDRHGLRNPVDVLGNVDRGGLALLVLRSLAAQVLKKGPGALCEFAEAVPVAWRNVVATVPPGVPPDTPALSRLRDDLGVLTGNMSTWRVWLQQGVGPLVAATPMCQVKVLEAMVAERGLSGEAAVRGLWAQACMRVHVPATVRPKLEPRAPHADASADVHPCVSTVRQTLAMDRDPLHHLVTSALNPREAPPGTMTPGPDTWDTPYVIAVPEVFMPRPGPGRYDALMLALMDTYGDNLRGGPDCAEGGGGGDDEDPGNGDGDMIKQAWETTSQYAVTLFTEQDRQALFCGTLVPCDTWEGREDCSKAPLCLAQRFFGANALRDLGKEGPCPASPLPEACPSPGPSPLPEDERLVTGPALIVTMGLKRAAVSAQAALRVFMCAADTTPDVLAYAMKDTATVDTHSITASSGANLVVLPGTWVPQGPGDPRRLTHSKAHDATRLCSLVGLSIATQSPYQLSSALVQGSPGVFCTTFAAMCHPYLKADLFLVYADKVRRALLQVKPLCPTWLSSPALAAFCTSVQVLMTLYLVSEVVVLCRVGPPAHLLTPGDCVRVGVLFLREVWHTLESPSPQTLQAGVEAVAHLCRAPSTHAGVGAVVSHLAFLTLAIARLGREDRGSPGPLPAVITDTWTAVRHAGLVFLAFQLQPPRLSAEVVVAASRAVRRRLAGQRIPRDIVAVACRLNVAAAACQEGRSGPVGISPGDSPTPLFRPQVQLALSAALPKDLPSLDITAAMALAWVPWRGVHLHLDAANGPGWRWATPPTSALCLASFAVQLDAEPGGGTPWVQGALQTPVFPLVLFLACVAVGAVAHGDQPHADTPEVFVAPVWAWIASAVGVPWPTVLAWATRCVAHPPTALAAVDVLKTMVACVTCAGGWEALWTAGTIGQTTQAPPRALTWVRKFVEQVVDPETRTDTEFPDRLKLAVVTSGGRPLTLRRAGAGAGAGAPGPEPGPEPSWGWVVETREALVAPEEASAAPWAMLEAQGPGPGPGLGPCQFPGTLGQFAAAKSRRPRSKAGPRPLVGNPWGCDAPGSGSSLFSPALLPCSVLETEVGWFAPRPGDRGWTQGTPVAPSDVQPLLDLLRTLTLARTCTRQAPEWAPVETASHPPAEALVSGFTWAHPRLPTLGAMLWPLDEEEGGVLAAATGMYGVCADPSTPDLGVSPRDLTPVCLEPFRHHADTLPLDDTKLVAPFCAPTPDLLMAIARHCDPIMTCITTVSV